MSNKKYYFQARDDGRVYQSTHPEVWTGCEALTRAEGERLYKAQQAQTIRDMLGEKPTLYTKVDSVSKSGMSRVISVYAVCDGEIRNLSYQAAIVTGWGEGKNGGVKVGGCGMDMGFHLVYTLSSIVYGDGYAIKQVWL